MRKHVDVQIINVGLPKAGGPSFEEIEETIDLERGRDFISTRRQVEEMIVAKKWGYKGESLQRRIDQEMREKYPDIC